MVEMVRPVLVVLLMGVMTGGLSGGLSHASSKSGVNHLPSFSPILLASIDLHSATIEDLRRRIEQDPTQSDLHVALGHVLESMGDLPGAIAEYTEALRLNPHDSKIFYSVSQARRSQRNREEQSELNSIQAHAAPAPESQDFRQGREWMAQGKLTEAVAKFRLGLVADHESQIGRQQLAEALLLMGEVDGAISELRAVIRRHPAVTHAYLRLGAALMIKQDWPAAKRVFEEALRRDSSLAEAHYNLGIVNYTMGKVTEALASYRQALTHHPDFSDAQFRLGLLLKIAGKSEEAVLAFQSAADQGMPRAEYFLGEAYRYGSGVKQDLPVALHWLFRASDHGVEPAQIALVQLRREALGHHGRATPASQKLKEAFHVFRHRMWAAFPHLVNRDDEKTVGMTFLQMGHVQEAVPLLIQEAAALSEESHNMLELMYEEGVGSELPPYDKRIIAYFEQSAREGLHRARMMLARIYGIGLGVPSDRDKALTLLQGHPDPAAQRLIQELTSPVSVP